MVCVSGGRQRRRQTYSFAVVAVGGNLALATAERDAGVALGVAPAVPCVLGDVVDRDLAAGDDGVGEAAVLGRSKASQGRGGDDERRVEHGGLCMEQKVSMPAEVSARSITAIGSPR